MPIFILSILIQLALVVHVLKTGRNTTWVFILIFAPMIGGLAYFIVELLPELMNSRAAHSARRRMADSVNPDRHLREATQNLDAADTVQNAMALAEQCLLKGRHAEAKSLYERSLKGVYADDPVLLLGLARACFGLGEAEQTLRALDQLKERNPSHRSPEGHLLYARALEQLGRKPEAIHEYEALCAYYPGPEPACRLAQMLKAGGEAARAADLFQGVVKQSRNAGRHYNQLHKEWVQMAQRETGGS
ncbi:hypothetical protein C3942_04980 [Solimonas fluminis]|uniref:Cardiolipin synthase N-terminal domain-containing protein n=1 Tax=Solimonas fluminis TaxID=2086571 RepID=A0A2S5TJB1_9GAMM|nr:tetratricopeptide repeat protein [Solimonas fluminis]PPE75032.1 hypothetical protein C3942_04980 [Solimonas fluminis]